MLSSSLMRKMKKTYCGKIVMFVLLCFILGSIVEIFIGNGGLKVYTYDIMHTKSKVLLSQETLLTESQRTQKVLLYTYMRGGSSFIGDLFQKNSEAVYWFEHADGFYQTEYALRPSLKPLNILYFTNRTKRIITEEEAEALAEYHNNIFSCKYESVSVDLFTDMHNRRRSTMNMTQCGLTHKDTDICREHVLNYCSVYNNTGQIPHQTSLLDNIEHSMKGNCFHNFRLMRDDEKDLLDPKAVEAFSSYIKCYDDVKRRFTENCQYSISQCKRAKIHALKSIRLTMELVEASLLKIPDMRLIYYIRDPRGIMSSRITQYKLLSFTPEEEIKILCDRMRLDALIYSELERKYPNRVTLIKYEDLAIRPFEISRQVYKFINTDIPPEVMGWLHEATNSSASKDTLKGPFDTTKANSTAVALSWTERLSDSFKKHALNCCSDVIFRHKYRL